jgi:hypothetical protein
MKRKALSLEDVSEASGINYWRVNRILKGRENARAALAKIETAVKRAPMPKEEAHV